MHSFRSVERQPLRFVYNISLCLCAMGLMITGCAPNQSPPLHRPVSAISEPSMDFWWYARFRMDWPDGNAPAWAMDLFLADAVVAPALASFRPHIPLWRFHRRALRDDAGHQFSFIFYTNRDTATQVFEMLKSSPVLQRLLRSGRVQDLLVDNVKGDRPVAMSATSDKHWSKALQTAWPHYIMGVSSMWLSLIDQFAPGLRDTDAEVEDMLAAYGRVNEQITLIWRNEAEHALFHHLNALFGYEPLDLQMKVRF